MPLSDKLAIQGLTPRKKRSRQSAKRRLRCETLEVRRLLVAEGDPFHLRGVLDAAGLVGDVSAVVRWGDGTTSPATTSGGNPRGNVRIRFDYSLDTGGFFSGAGASRRNLLQIAADSLVKRFGDDLAAITPGGIKEWQPSVFHPSIGPAGQLAGNLAELPKNLSVAANEIIIYPGARDLPGSARGNGGPASFRFPATRVTCRLQSECDQKLAEIEAFRATVRTRGEPGVAASPQTDIAPSLGSISFDTNTNWFFGLDPREIQPGQLDFISVAAHELAHVLGFGIVRTDVTTSWSNLTRSGAFTGPAARAAYLGTGNVPVESSHWSPAVLDVAGQPTLLAAELPTGQRQLPTPLDFAALDDLGWDLLDTGTTVTASHRFPDDGVYAVDVVLRGSIAGEIVHRISDVTVTNQAPTLLLANQHAVARQPTSFANFVSLTDPGYDAHQNDPPSTETFTYTIDWGDGSPIEEGTATIDRRGNGDGLLTSASFDAAHTYQHRGTKPVTVRVMDDDGGTTEGSFFVFVAQPPALTLQIDQSAVHENDGPDAATLTIRRSGSPTGSDQTVNLASSDPSEATVPATVVIPGDATFVTAPVQAVDDALLDGDLAVKLSATAHGVDPDNIDLIVRDSEFLGATFTAAAIREDAADSVSLVLRRSNTDTDRDLDVNVAGGNPLKLPLPSQVTIPAGRQQISMPLAPVDNDEFGPALLLSYVFTATGYPQVSGEITLLDDEPALFQNPSLRFDVNDDGDVTSADALRVINQLVMLGGISPLDPALGQPEGVFLDVSGDYFVSAIDALLVINELSRMHDSPAPQGESVAGTMVSPAEKQRESRSMTVNTVRKDDRLLF